MKNATTCARKLSSLLKKLPAAEPTLPPEGPDPLAVLVHSFLLWESRADKANAAYAKLREAIVDANDLRVTLPHEIVDVIGTRYPLGLERARRLRASLRDVYLREHAMTLERVADLGKREIRRYLDSLEGIVPYVASRVMLLCFDVHAIPIDEQLRGHLVQAESADATADVEELSAWVTRQVRSGRGIAMHAALQAWSDRNATTSRGGRRKTTAGRSGGKKKTTATKARASSSSASTRGRKKKKKSTARASK